MSTARLILGFGCAIASKLARSSTRSGRNKLSAAQINRCFVGWAWQSKTEWLLRSLAEALDSSVGEIGQGFKWWASSTMTRSNWGKAGPTSQDRHYSGGPSRPPSRRLSNNEKGNDTFLGIPVEATIRLGDSQGNAEVNCRPAA